MNKLVESKKIDLKELKIIVEQMLRAPSGDNSQHWKFKFFENQLFVFHEHDRARHVFNSNFHASKIALGSLLESAKIAASAKGYAVHEDILLVEDSFATEHWATLSFIATDTPEDRLAKCISKRESNRNVYQGGRLDHPVFEKISADIINNSLCSLRFIDEFSTELLSYISEAETFVWQTEAARHDLHRWIRFDQEKAAETRDGLPWRNLGISWLEKSILKAAKPAMIQKTLNIFGFLKMSKNVSHRNVVSSAALGLISVKETRTPALIEAGRVLLRVWLHLNGSGFGFQLQSAATLPLFDYHSGNFTVHASSKFRKLYREALPQVQNWFGSGVDEIPLLAFRTGLACPLHEISRTYRLSVEQALEIVD